MSHQSFILLVEDDERLRAIEARYLTAAGYIVLEAATFAEALDKLTIKPNVVILDIFLPDLSGWEVARWLESQTSNVPVIITSGSDIDPRKMRRFKPAAVLPKPFGMPELLGLVVKHTTAS